MGQYLFPEGTSDYLKHEIYACPSSTITHNTSTGELIEYPLSYWVNPFGDENGKLTWADNGWLRPFDSSHADYESKTYEDWWEPREKNEYFTNLAQIHQADQLMSIYDCAQGGNGIVSPSGAGGFISHGPDIWDEHWPKPWYSHDPDTYIGAKLRPAQNGVEYWRGGVDFRHPKDSLNAVFFDGHAARLINGQIKNKNTINQ